MKLLTAFLCTLSIAASAIGQTAGYYIPPGVPTIRATLTFTTGNDHAYTVPYSDDLSSLS